MEVPMYNYRNIDEDINLFKFAKRYYSEEQLTIDQLKYIAKEDGYSEREIDLAVNDYYWIHIHSKILIERMLLFFVPLSVFLFLIRIIVKA